MWMEILDHMKNERNEEAKLILQELHKFRELTDTSGSTLLHYSTKYGNIEMTQHLIDKGCNVNAQEDSGNTPLMLAVKGGDVRMVEVLLKNNADAFVTDHNGSSILELAFNLHLHPSKFMPFVMDLTQRSSLILEMLFQKVNRDFLSGTSSSSSKQLLLNVSDSLKLAIVVFGNVEISRYMLDNGYPTDYREPIRDFTALHCAIRLARIENAKILLEYGVDVGALDKTGSSPLRYYIGDFEDVDENSEVLKFFLRYSPRLSTYGRYCCTELETLLTQGKKKTARTVLLSGVDVDACLSENSSLLSLLIENDEVGILDLFDELNIKVDANELDQDGTTALMPIALYGCAKKVNFLLQHGADVNTTSRTGYSALTNALTVGLCSTIRSPEQEVNQAKVIELLLQYGADNDDLQSFFTDKQNVINPSSLSAKLIVAHLAMIETVGQSCLTESSRKRIESTPLFKDYFDLCTRQLEEMKYSEVHDTLTLFQLLREREEKVVGYIRNQQLLAALSKAMKNLTDLEPYYRNILRKRLDTARLQTKVALAIETLTGFCSDVYHVIVYKIISYLDRRDLRNLSKIENIL